MSQGKRKRMEDELKEDMTTGHLDATTDPARFGGFGSAIKGPFDKSEIYFRNLYAAAPDFRVLGSQDPVLATFLDKNGQINFTEPAAVMQLTKTLLMLDFGLGIELPEDRLCPPVPNRHNYILWLKDLLDSSSYCQPGRQLSGLDIGTGASCIYPLLGASQRPWTFLATDIDRESLSYARKNIEKNGLESRIRLVARQPQDNLIPLNDLSIQSIDFVMTNPPFYESADELLALAKKKSRPPSSACTGAPVEMVCDGGEVAFVSRILSESLILRNRVQWYTSMLGKTSSLEILVGRLRENGIFNYAVTELIQGNKTKRWAVAWTFGNMRPAQAIARGIASPAWRRLLPQGTEATLLTTEGFSDVTALPARICQLLGKLQLISWEWDAERLRGVGRAAQNVWSRAWRRKQAHLHPAEATAQQHVPIQADEQAVLGFTVDIQARRRQSIIRARWVEGFDAPLFESLVGFLQRELRGLATVEAPSHATYRLPGGAA